MNFEEPMEEVHNVEIMDNNLEGRYANFFKVGYSAFEFVFDFGQLYTGDQTGPVHTRVITSPFHAKVLVKLLRDSINQHEQTFGTIPNNGDQ